MGSLISDSINGGRRYWIQYHNYDKLGEYPAGGILKEKKNIVLSEFIHTITTSKHMINQTKGETIFLIFGLTVDKKKQYFLWSKTIVKKIEKDRNLMYDAFSGQSLLYPPQHLNNESGFDEFKHKTGNFGIGLQEITNWPFLKVLQNLSESFRCKNEDSLTYKKYIKDSI